MNEKKINYCKYELVKMLFIENVLNAELRGECLHCIYLQS